MILLVLIAGVDASAIRLERVLLIVVLVAIGAALPLTSAWKELRHPRDAEPLSIDSNYIKDDRFFATSFESRVVEAVGPSPREPGPSAVVFRDPEVIDTVAGDLTIERDEVPASIVDVHRNLRVGSGTHLIKEVLIGGSATIEQDSTLRAIKSQGDIRLGRNVRIERWIDAGWTIFASASTDLGVRATALQSIVLEPGAVFRFVAAPIVSVGTPPPATSKPAVDAKPLITVVGERRHRVRADGALIVDGPFVLPAGLAAKGDIIARSDVTIGERALLIGSIHSDRDIHLEAEASVTGSMVAERDVILARSAAAESHVVAHGRASLSNCARVCSPGSVTTLLADDGVEIALESAVYGRIITYGLGRAVT